MVNRLADSLEYVGHPYGSRWRERSPHCSPSHSTRFRNYEKSQIVTSRMLLVVVGNIDRAHLEPVIQRTLAQLPHGNYSWSPPRPPAKLGRALVVKEAALPTNYLLGYYAGPSAKDPDYQALRVATAVLRSRRDCSECRCPGTPNVRPPSVSENGHIRG